ncbi:MAG: hypothetical protein Q9162_000094 [Coniocarpon cinnabarinum]
MSSVPIEEGPDSSRTTQQPTNPGLLITPESLGVTFHSGNAKPQGQNYTKTLVMPRMKNEAIDWIDKEIPPEIAKAVYVVDDLNAPLHPPQNKGHEVMVYLTFIIENYDDLPDVAMFMHAHQISWHNNDLFDLDAAEMVRRLSPERVTREGYMSLRCQWSPGCPEWVHPGETHADDDKQEEVLMAKAWAEIFPADPIPGVIGAPCCAQFALSRDRIRAIPKVAYLYYRNWLTHTHLDDFVSGRVWEYLWHYVFTGNATFCPVEHVCYCDGYGVCFGGQEQYDSWWDIRNERDYINDQWLEWEANVRTWNSLIELGHNGEELEEMKNIKRPQRGLNEVYSNRTEKLEKAMDGLLKDALERGKDPRLRAEECGREWHEGDGY